MSVRGLRRGTMAGRGSAGTPTTYTIFGDVSDGYLDGPAGAADGAGGSAYTNIDAYCGQNGGASGTAYQAFLAFDTSSISDTATITAVTLSLWGVTDSSTTDFTIEVRSHDWGASLLTGDWLSRATIATKTLVASRSTAGFSTSGYNIFTSEAAFLAAINKTGFTRLVVNSSIWRAAGAGSDLVGFKTSDAAGTTNDPKLVIEALV